MLQSVKYGRGRPVVQAYMLWVYSYQWLSSLQFPHRLVFTQAISVTLCICCIKCQHVFCAVCCGHLIKQAIADDSTLGQMCKSFVERGVMGRCRDSDFKVFYLCFICLNVPKHCPPKIKTSYCITPERSCKFYLKK